MKGNIDIRSTINTEDAIIIIKFDKRDLEAAGAYNDELLRNSTEEYKDEWATNIINSIDFVVDDVKEKYKTLVPDVDWETWAWWYEIEPTRNGSINFAFYDTENSGDAVPYDEYDEYYYDDEDFLDGLDECIPDYDPGDTYYPVSNRASGNTLMVLAPGTEEYGDDLAYSIDIPSLQKAAEVCKTLSIAKMKSVSLYKSNSGSFILDIGEDIPVSVRVKITNIVTGEYNLKYLDKKQSEMARSYADEHNTYIIKNDAVSVLCG